MSSHHFVREGQEPAVFVLDPVGFELVGPLLEWAPLIMVNDSALAAVSAWGIKIDVVIAPEDRVRQLTGELADQAPVKILSAGSDPIETVLFYLTRVDQMAITIVTGSAIRPEKIAVPPAMSVTILNAEIRWFHVSSGRLKKWYPAGAKFRFPAGKEPSLKLGIEGSGVFRSVADGIVELEDSGPFWVGEVS